MEKIKAVQVVQPGELNRAPQSVAAHFPELFCPFFSFCLLLTYCARQDGICIRQANYLLKVSQMQKTCGIWGKSSGSRKKPDGASGFPSFCNI